MKSKTIIIFVILFIFGSINICLSSNPAEQVALVFVKMAINRIKNPNTAKELERKAKMGEHIYAYRIDSGDHFVDIIELTKEFVKEASIVKEKPLSEDEVSKLNNLYNSLSNDEKNTISSMSKCSWEVMSKYPEEIMDNSNKTEIYKKGDTVDIGNWSVRVPVFFDSKRLLTKVLKECETHYLVFPIEITNKSKKSLNCPLITLIDENNNEFNWSNWSKVKVFLDGKDISMSEYEDFLPSITKVKVLIFDAPPDRDYRLKIYDNKYDFNSKSFVYIDLLK